jgi:hypothetical protein
MQVYINGITDNSLMLRIKKNCKVEELKNLISEQYKISNEVLNLSFGGKLLKDPLLLSDYNIISNSVINCEHINNGGNFKFIDVNKTDGIKKLTIGKANAWKKYVSGLNLEGYCRNKNCKAYNKKVICQMGYLDYVFEEDDNKVVCPICKKNIMPESCGFSKCVFKIIGKKYNNGKLEKIDDKIWKLVKNGYYSYDPDKTKIIYWESLIIKVNKIPDNIEFYTYINIDDLIYNHKS